jgi:hypothetical protein
MKKLVILSGVALLCLAGSAVAQPPEQGPRRGADVTRAEVIQRTDAAFARLDSNRDGRFTREEAQARRQERREQRQTRMFDRLDADNNGQISREEFAQARRGRAMRGQQGPGPMAEGGPDGMRRDGGPGMRRFRHRGARMGMRMRMGARMFGENGFITAEQFRARALARFDRADTNHDGTLTAEERRAHRMERRHHRRMGPPPGAPGAPPPPSPEPTR